MTSPNPEVVLEILQHAAENEVDTRRFYLDAAERTNDPRGQDMYRFLADEEELHLRIVQVQINSLTAGKGWIRSPEIQSGPFENLQTLFQVPREELREQVRADDKAMDALLVALEMEDGSFKVYQQAIEETDDPAGKEILGYLARAEQSHFNLVMQNYEALLHEDHWRGITD